MANLIQILVWDEFPNLEAFDTKISERSSGNCFKIPRYLQGKNPSLQRVWMSLIMPRRCSFQGLKMRGFWVHCRTHVIFFGVPWPRWWYPLVMSTRQQRARTANSDVGLNTWRLDVPIWCVWWYRSSIFWYSKIARKSAMKSNAFHISCWNKYVDFHCHVSLVKGLSLFVAETLLILWCPGEDYIKWGLMGDQDCPWWRFDWLCHWGHQPTTLLRSCWS